MRTLAIICCVVVLSFLSGCKRSADQYLPIALRIESTSCSFTAQLGKGSEKVVIVCEPLCWWGNEGLGVCPKTKSIVRREPVEPKMKKKQLKRCRKHRTLPHYPATKVGGGIEIIGAPRPLDLSTPLDTDFATGLQNFSPSRLGLTF